MGTDYLPGEGIVTGIETLVDIISDENREAIVKAIRKYSTCGQYAGDGGSILKDAIGATGWLSLNGLTTLSDAATESLGKHDGQLCLNGLTSLSDAAAESLSKHEGGLDLNGLTELSDGPGHIALVESLSEHEGHLHLVGLTELSDAAAESLSKHEGGARPQRPNEPFRRGSGKP